MNLWHRILCSFGWHYLFVDMYGRFEGECVCIGCGKRKVFRESA